MPNPAVRRSMAGLLAAAGVFLVAACTAAPLPSSPATATPQLPSVPASSSHVPARATTRSAPAGAAETALPTSTATAPPAATAAPAAAGPVIVLDPGHAPPVSDIDQATGLNDSDYENEPEMRDVYDVALLVRQQLLSAGYRVVMTKTSLEDRVPLGQRAAIANNAHAVLALSIHDQAGSSGGIGFTNGNNIVYDQAVGDYRQAPSGSKVTFIDNAVAALSQRYGRIFQTARQSAQGVPVTLQSNTGYDLGSRGLAGGNIWMVQLLSKVPWIYNEAGGDSAGMSGLDAADKQRYADGLVTAVERCIPLP